MKNNITFVDKIAVQLAIKTRNYIIRAITVIFQRKSVLASVLIILSICGLLCYYVLNYIKIKKNDSEVIKYFQIKHALPYITDNEAVELLKDFHNTILIINLASDLSNNTNISSNIKNKILDYAITHTPKYTIYNDAIKLYSTIFFRKYDINSDIKHLALEFMIEQYLKEGKLQYVKVFLENIITLNNIGNSEYLITRLYDILYALD